MILIDFLIQVIQKDIFHKKKNSQEKVFREIELHRRLSGHKNIVGFIDCIVDLTSIHIIIEYCGKKSLLHLLRKTNRITEDQVCRCAIQLTE